MSDWTLLTPGTNPGTRIFAGLALDTARVKAVLFGGSPNDASITLYNDTWEWDGTDWAEILNGSTNSPTPRGNFAYAYDQANNRTVMFGGINTGVYMNDTWVYDGATWTLLTPATSPSVRADASMAYDANSGYVLLFGGRDGAISYDETWKWDGTTWTLLTPIDAPSARAGPCLAYDETNNNTLLFGGGFGDTDTWIWDGSNWIVQAPGTSPPPYGGRVMGYSSDCAAVVIAASPPAGGAFATWQWDGSDWAAAAPLGSPSDRLKDSVCGNVSDGQLLLYGGGKPTDPTVAYDETWVYQCAAPTTSHPYLNATFSTV